MQKILLPAALLILTLAPPAHAQSIDYASLQTMFGEPVTTSATGKPQRVSESPVDMSIVTADDIRRSGAKDIAEVLRGVSGVNVLQSTRQAYDVNIRGYIQAYSPNILVLVNGRQVYLDDYGYTNWAAIPVQMSEIRQIEIVKGPNTALFGFNAANGVINIVTMNPLYDNVGNASISSGTGSYYGGSLVKTVKMGDRVGVRVSGGYDQAEEFSERRNPDEPLQLIDDPHRLTTNIDTLVQVTDKSQLRIEGSVAQTEQTEMTAFNFMTRARYNTQSAKVDYEADTAMGLIKATAYRNWLSKTYTGDLYDPDISTDIKNNISVMQLSDTFKVGLSNTFRLMGEYRHNAAYGGLIGPDDASIMEDVYAASAMWAWTINDKWEWTNSARVDRLQLAHGGAIDPASILTDADFDRNITKPSWNSGLVWKATPQDTFRLNTGRGLRMASLLSFGISLDPGATLGPWSFLQVGNPGYEPTEVTSYEIGWNHDKIDLIDGSFSVNAFYETSKNDLAPTSDPVACPAPLAGALGCTIINPTTIVGQGSNVGSSHTIGGEFEVKGRIDENWSWSFNDTIQKIFNDHVDPTVNTLAQTPLNIANLRFSYTDGPWEWDIYTYHNTRFKQPMQSNNITLDAALTDIPSHLSFSSRLAYKINDLTTLSVSGSELQSMESTTSTALKTERRAYVSLDRVF